MPRVFNMLTGVTTAELSVVPNGANNKRFALTKEHDMPFSEVIKNLMNTEAEGEDVLRKALEKAGTTGDALDACIASYRMQHGFADKLSKATVAAIATAAGFTVKAVDENEGVDPKKPDARSGKPDPKASKRDALGKEAQVEVDAIRKELDDNKAETEQLRKELAGVTRAALRKELTSECEKEFPHVPGISSAEQADMLLKARDAGDGLEEALRKQWGATTEAIKKSPLLHAAGTATQGGTGDASGQLDTIAKELIAKDTTGKLSYAKAYDLGMQQNPSLYREYLNQNPAQTARQS